MFRSLKDPDQQSDLGKADRSFALAINGQRFEDISREEAKRLRQPRPACDVAPCGQKLQRTELSRMDVLERKPNRHSELSARKPGRHGRPFAQRHSPLPAESPAQVFSRRHARDHTGGAPGRRLGSFGVTHLALQMVAWWRGEGFTPAKALEALDFRWARWSKEPVA